MLGTSVYDNNYIIMLLITVTMMMMGWFWWWKCWCDDDIGAHNDGHVGDDDNWAGYIIRTSSWETLPFTPF